MLALSMAIIPASASRAADPTPPFPELADILRSVVKIRTFVPPEADSAKRLGSERDGYGVVVGEGGLIVTVGYLVMESMSIEIIDDNGRTRTASLIGFDSEAGLGLLRSPGAANLKPLPLGDSEALKIDTPVVVAGAGGPSHAMPAVVVSRRPFAGPWEYLLEHAIYVAPGYSEWSGAAVLSTDGKLLGIGSLLVGQARRDGERLRGNVFVPVDLLRPLLEDIAATGRLKPQPHPWLGLNATPHPGGLIVGRLSDHSPAQAAGVKRGDLVTAVAGRPVSDLVDFYHRVWTLGSPGVVVPLTIMREGRTFDIKVRSADRYQFLAKERTY